MNLVKKVCNSPSKCIVFNSTDNLILAIALKLGYLSLIQTVSN